MKTARRIVALLLVLVTLVSSLVACPNNGTVIDNENTRLVLSTSELDGVFNPFYSSSAADNSIIGMTQIGMLSADEKGNVAYGEDEACVVLDYATNFITDPVSGKITHTEYYFVLKNNVKFSNGSALTMRDVLFNLYVYLDPTYYGSSTIYSTDIVGLQEYRTQNENASVQDKFEEQFDALADNRVQRLLDCLEIVYDNNENSMTEAQMLAQLTEVMNDAAENADPAYATVVDDYKLALNYFRDELETDYTYAVGTAQDISFTDANGNKVTLTTDTEAFFYNEGLITWNKDEKKFEYSLGEDSKNWSKEQAINAIFSTYVPNQVNVVVTTWQTAVKLQEYFAFLEMEEYFKNNTEKIDNVSGIVYANRKESVEVNGVTYGIPELAADGSVISGNEVLKITINEVDPKAIWNFGFTVAPMYYYSNAEQIELFDYEEHFGVEFGSITFQDEVIKNKDKIGVPVGAGAYKATTQNGDSANVTKDTFKELNVVHFERNEHFLFPVKIKYINYQVVSTNLMLDTLYSGGVHFVEPACKQENIDNLDAHAADGFAYSSVRTNGYGYIGINAEKVPNLAVRQAIMHAINTQYAVDYYFGYSDNIYRPMTKESWAYPEDDGGKQYYAFDETGKTSEDLVKAAGYSINDDGIYEHPKTGDVLEYTFTIAGDTTDHPAYNSLKLAAEILNKRGFKIDVKTDINALKKLNNGDLTVWAAAWGSGIDPDMYQVYHIDSTAGSTANWGYRAIRKNAGGKYETELALVKQLSDVIDLARETLDVELRKEYYAEALELVMKLAVELPTYQRSDLFAYNASIIDASTLTPKSELTSHNGPLSRIWEVSLKETAN